MRIASSVVASRGSSTLATVCSITSGSTPGFVTAARTCG
jgi:hypothetical protein